jgi:hypothetical protein
VPFRVLKLSDKRSNERSEITALAVGYERNYLSEKLNNKFCFSQNDKSANYAHAEYKIYRLGET